MLGVDSAVPLTTNNFEIRVYGLDGDLASQFDEMLTLYTKEIGEIREEQDQIVVHYGNGLIKFPGKVTFPDTDWTLNCFCHPDIAEKLVKWRKQVYDPSTEKMGLPSQYRKNVYLVRYDGQGNMKQCLKLPGVYIGAISYGEYNQEGNQVVQIKVPLVISKVEYLTEDQWA